MSRLDRVPRAGIWLILATGLHAACGRGMILSDDPAEGPPADPGGASPAPGAPKPPAPPSAACTGGRPVLVPARVRRLTAAEYQATLAAIVGSAPAMPAAFPKDSLHEGYANHSDSLRVTSVLAQNLWDAAPRIAAQLAQALMQSPPCRPMGANNEACAQQILSAVAARAYRRPAAAEEIAELVDVYRVGAMGADFATGLATALRVVVQSAELLYRAELGAGPPRAGAVPLTAHEVAAALAYLTTGGPPDAMLAAAADGGQILSADVRAAHAQRLLAIPAARPTMGTFGAQWLGATNVATPASGDADPAGRDARLFPDWPRVRDRALGETQAFFARAVLDENATLATLFTADWTVADTTMVTFYGARPADPSGRVVLPAGQRAGVLTHAAVLAARATQAFGAPVQRGHFVTERLLCNPVPPPPPTLNVSLPPPDPNRTTRQLFAAHASNPACVGCHAKFDPPGFAFENFDAIGRYRTTENRQPIDATGTLVDSDVDGSFNGAVELSARLARSAQARECFARQWFQYSMGHGYDDGARCGVRATAADFIAGRGGVRDLVVGWVRSDMFVTRAGAP